MVDIIVRNTVESDLAAIAELYRGPQAAAGTLQNPYVSTDVWKKRLNELPEGVYSLVALIDDEVVGQAGFSAIQRARRNHAGHIGMAVRDDQHGNGIGSALMTAMVDLADNWLGLRRIELTVYTDNAPAIALYEKFGFEVEGEAKGFALRGGQYVDAYYMARTVVRR